MSSLVDDADGYRFRRYRSARRAVVATRTLALPLSAILLEKPVRP